jgi:serine/threonine protein kinase
MVEDLSISLKKIHEFQIAHMDIKTENVLYCKSLKKLVFIDFGFAEVVKYRLGYMGKQNFKGSLFYCSD